MRFQVEMYPSTYFNLFPAFPKTDRVFVAMSFDPGFEARWKNVIAPAIESVSVNGNRLSAHRVDTTRVNDSILTEILNGIADDRIVFADITSSGRFRGKPVRNGNVMYEIGIAHATRLPEEVLIYRSDNDPLLFDVTQIRVTTYTPDTTPSDACKAVAARIVDSLNELDARRHLAVRKAVTSLGFECASVMMLASAGLEHPAASTVRDALSIVGVRAAIDRLLDMGILDCPIPRFTPEHVVAEPQSRLEPFFKYTLTPFGGAVFGELQKQIGLDGIDQERWDEVLGTN